jgi:hypothetical protein
VADLFIGDRAVEERQVIAHTGTEQLHILRDDGDAATWVSTCASRMSSVDLDAAGFGSYRRKMRRQSRFACRCDSQSRTGLRLKGTQTVSLPLYEKVHHQSKCQWLGGIDPNHPHLRKLRFGQRSTQADGLKT